MKPDKSIAGGEIIYYYMHLLLVALWAWFVRDTGLLTL